METKNKLVYVQPEMAVVEIEINRNVMLNASTVEITDWDDNDKVDEEM